MLLLRPALPLGPETFVHQAAVSLMPVSNPAFKRMFAEAIGCRPSAMERDTHATKHLIDIGISGSLLVFTRIDFTSLRNRKRR